jgi:hypothetical protein
MKRLFVLFIVSLVSIFTFAKCDFFQIANDCNGQSTTVIAKNDTVSLDIHANWNQGNISYKFQSGPEKLDMIVYANDMNRLYTQVTYKNKSALMYYDFNLGQMTSNDIASLSTLWQSIDPTFLAKVELLFADLPQGTPDMNLIGNITLALFSHNSSPITVNAMPWDYAAYAVCYGARVAGGDSSSDAEEICYHKYIAKDWNK